MSSVLNKFKQAAKETKVKEQEVTVTDEFSSIASQLMDISALDAATVLELLHVVRGKINVEPANATLFVRTLQQLATLEPKNFKYVPLSERELFNNDKALKNHVSVGCNPVADLTPESWGARQYRGEWGSTIPAGEMAKLLHTRDKNVDTKFLKTLESISGMEQFMDVLPTLPDLALNQVFAECTTFAKNAVTATRHHSTALYSYRGQDIFAGLKGTYAGSSPLVAGANLTPVADASTADYVFSNKFDGTDKCIADMPYTTYAIWAQTAASVPNVYLHPNEFNRVLVTNVPIRLKPLDDEWKEIIATMIKCQAYAAVYMSIKMDVTFYIGLMALLEELYGYFDYVGKITIKTITYDYPRTVKRKAGNTPSPAPDVDMKSASIRTRSEFEDS